MSLARCRLEVWKWNWSRCWILKSESESKLLKRARKTNKMLLLLLHFVSTFWIGNWGSKHTHICIYIRKWTLDDRKRRQAKATCVDCQTHTWNQIQIQDQGVDRRGAVNDGFELYRFGVSWRNWLPRSFFLSLSFFEWQLPHIKDFTAAFEGERKNTSQLPQQQQKIEFQANSSAKLSKVNKQIDAVASSKLQLQLEHGAFNSNSNSKRKTTTNGPATCNF